MGWFNLRASHSVFNKKRVVSICCCFIFVFLIESGDYNMEMSARGRGAVAGDWKRRLLLYFKYIFIYN